VLSADPGRHERGEPRAFRMHGAQLILGWEGSGTSQMVVGLSFSSAAAGSWEIRGTASHAHGPVEQQVDLLQSGRGIGL
jgi:hypothetical protein